MAQKKTMKPIRLFVPITRMERRDDGLLVEGYCYVNAEVGDAYNLKRAAMEAASADYLTWGAVREMHQPLAAGTATADGCGVTWDDKGAFLRALVVDDAAIKKCETGVYKGFSVGIQPQLVRGRDVEKCVWIENSLVDRPADPDAVFTIARAEGVDLDAESEVVILDETEEIPGEEMIERGAFAEKMAKRENPMKRGLAFDILYSCLDRIVCDGAIADPEAAAREAIAEFADYVGPLIGARNLPDELYYGAGLTGEILTRLSAATQEAVTVRAERSDLIARAEKAETDLAAVRAELATAIERASTLERQPDPRQQVPVRFPQALERSFLAGQDGQPQNAETKTLQDELTELTRSIPSEPDQEKRKAGVVRMQQIKMQLAAVAAE